MFYSKNYAQMAPQMQGAQQRISAAAGRQGLTGAGVTSQLQAGIPGQFANAALSQANQQALGVAGQKASLLGGAPVSAPYSFGNDINSMMQTLSLYGMLKGWGQGGGNKPGQGGQPGNQWWIQGPGHGTSWT